MRLFRFAFIMIFAGLPVGSLAAQTYQGRILGLIIDSSGAVVAGAKVMVTNLLTGVSRTLLTNSAGEYVAPDLDPGSYKVTSAVQASDQFSIPICVRMNA
jgi:Carboxypeptidase regulatory-like domain